MMKASVVTGGRKQQARPQDCFPDDSAKPKLMDRLGQASHSRHYSRRTGARIHVTL